MSIGRLAGGFILFLWIVALYGTAMSTCTSMYATVTATPFAKMPAKRSAHEVDDVGHRSRARWRGLG